MARVVHQLQKGYLLPKVPFIPILGGKCQPLQFYNCQGLCVFLMLFACVCALTHRPNVSRTSSPAFGDSRSTISLRGNSNVQR